MVKIKESSGGVKQGQLIGSWTILGKPFTAGTNYFLVVAKCKCGRVRVLRCGSLSAGGSKGCHGCATSKQKTRHGDARKKSTRRLYRCWQSIKHRCLNPNSGAFADYGGRGIRICDEWRDSYEAFRAWSLVNGYSDEKEIDRRENSGYYEPGNCRWVNLITQARNKRNNRMIAAFSETKCLAAWVEDPRCVVQKFTLLARLDRGWGSERAITEPIRRRK